MSFRNQPTARTLGMTDKISTWSGPESSPPDPSKVGLGDIWFVETETDPNLIMATARWDGTTWQERTVNLTGRFIDLSVDGSILDMSDLKTVTGGVYSGEGRLVRIGQMVFTRIEVQRASGFNASYHTIPGLSFGIGFQPFAIRQFPATPDLATPSERYQFRVMADATIEIRETGPITQLMTVQSAYALF